MTFNPSVHLAGVEAAAIASDLASGGSMQLRSGTKPATPETTATGTLLANVPLSSWTAAGNVLTSNDPPQQYPSAAGTPTWARLYKSDGTTVVGDLDVSATGAGGDVQLQNTSLSTTIYLDLSAATITIPEV